MKGKLCYDKTIVKSINPALIKRYLAAYKKNPKSRVFALLAEVYRKKGNIEKALALCQKGLKEHPQFALGHIALALIFMDMNKLEMAAEALEKATDFSPENIFAYNLLGQTWLQLKNPEKTLQAYKMVLFLDPGNKKAENIIKKLEPLTAAQYDKTGFAFQNIQEVARHISTQTSNTEDNPPPTIHPILKINSQKEMEQFAARSSMIEALIYRREFTKARQFLLEMKNIYTHHKQLRTHITMLENKLPAMSEEPQLQHLNTDTNTEGFDHKKTNIPQNTISQINTGKSRKNQKKIQKLRQLLAHIEHLQSQTTYQP